MTSHSFDHTRPPAGHLLHGYVHVLRCAWRSGPRRALGGARGVGPLMVGVGLLLDRAAGRLARLWSTAATLRSLADVDHDDLATEVHHLSIGNEGGVVVPTHLTCRTETSLYQSPAAVEDALKMYTSKCK